METSPETGERGGIQMSLRIAFIGYNEELTRTFFREMSELNREQISFRNLQQGRIVLLDGTEILRVSPSARFVSVNFDQVIIADDRRRHCEIKNSAILTILAHRMVPSPVPPEFKWQYYDLDAEVGA